MTKKGRILILLAVVLVAAATVLGTRSLGWWGREDDRPLELHGNVDIRQVDLGFRVGGRIASMPFEEGARVKAGTILATLDDVSARDTSAGAEADLRSATAQLEKLRRGNRPQEIAQAAAQVAERRAALERAREEYERRRGLVRSGAVSEALFEASTAAYQAARAQLTAAQEGLSLLRAGARREDIAAARAAVAAAQSRLSSAGTTLADTRLRAPANGVVLTRAQEPGAIVQGGTTIYTLTVERPVWARVYVSERDLGRIQPGMAALVRTGSSDREYRGRIGFISPTAEFTPKTVETEDLRADLVYRVRVIVDAPDGALRQGQPVTARVPGARPPRRD